MSSGDHGNLGEAEGAEEDFDEEEILGGEEEEEILGEEGMEELTPQEEEAALVGLRVKDVSITKISHTNTEQKLYFFSTVNEGYSSVWVSCIWELAE